MAKTTIVMEEQTKTGLRRANLVRWGAVNVQKLASMFAKPMVRALSAARSPEHPPKKCAMEKTTTATGVSMKTAHDQALFLLFAQRPAFLLSARSRLFR